MKTRTDQYEAELRDPALSAMLRGAFADDPALAESPGRSERIMRRILANGPRPAPRRVFWTSFGWATGAVGFAVLLLTFALGFLRLPQGGQIADRQQVKPSVVAEHPGGTAPAVTPTQPVPTVSQPTGDRAPRTLADRHPRTVVNELRVLSPQPVKPAARLPKPPVVVATKDHPEHIAAALYSAGVAAQSAGDNESALNAYQASYDTVPTPEALLASARILENMGEQTLSGEGS